MIFVFDQLPDDSRQAIDAAAAMAMREIDFFRLAFRRWDGRDIENSRLERVFADYMFHQEIPHWVRHFAREVLELRDAGVLDPRVGDPHPFKLDRIAGLAGQLVGHVLLRGAAVAGLTQWC